MKTFKVGDRVRRIKYNHGGMKIGDIGTVIWVSSMGFTVILKEYPHSHSKDNLTKAGSINCPEIIVKEHHQDSI